MRLVGRGMQPLGHNEGLVLKLLCSHKVIAKRIIIVF